MIVDELDLVARLGEVEPVSDEALASAEAALRAAMTAATGIEPARARRWARRSLVGAGAAAAAAIVALGSLALAGGGAGLTAARRTTGTTPHPAATVTVPARRIRIQLAGYRLALPAGYKAVSQNCPALPPNLDVNVGVRTLGESPYAAAETGTGSCIEVILAAGPLATPPSGAQEVQVGPYPGYLVTNPNSLELYVDLPSAGGQHAVVLFASGLTADQLIAVAQSGLPPSNNSAVRTTPCTSNCG